MGSVTPPSRNDPKDPYEGYRVEPLESDRLAKEDQGQKGRPSLDKTSFLLVYLYVFLNKLVQFFEDKTERGVSTRIELDVRKNLIRLGDSLDRLKMEDKSQDIEFLNQLSNEWHEVSQDSRRFRKDSPFSAAFRLFVKDLQTYPSGEEHSLGYYFSSHAGQKWLPFPYMAMIFRVHQEYRDNPVESALHRWTQEIDNLIGILNPR
jgi:hypothetical protein